MGTESRKKTSSASPPASKTRTRTKPASTRKSVRTDLGAQPIPADRVREMLYWHQVMFEASTHAAEDSDA
jgi:hypothetical protein